MPRGSCIEYPARARFVLRRADYVAICDGNACAAELLSVFAHWTDTRLANAEERSGALWVVRGLDELRDDLLGAYGLDKIRDSLALLVERGLLERRSDPGDRPFDHRREYALNVKAVQAALNGGLR